MPPLGFARLMGAMLACTLAGTAGQAQGLRLHGQSEANAASSPHGTGNDLAGFAHPITRDTQAPLVSLGADGRLHYRLYSERGAPRARNIVPDFSRAGYQGGGVALPDRQRIPVQRILTPDAGGEDAAPIQAALNAVAKLAPDAHGIRGAVLLKRGRYTLATPLTLPVGGVILRGEGRSSDGTVLRSTTTARQGRIIEVGNPESSIPRADRRPQRTAIAADHVAVGAMRIEVASSAGYRVGDTIAIARTPNDAWTGPAGVDTAQYGWLAKDYAMYYERRVTGINHNTLSLDAPIVDAIEARFGGGHVYRTDIKRIAQVGIEDLRIEGDPDTGTVNGTPDTGPYTAIRFGGVRDSWVRNVTVRYVSHGFTTHHGAHFNTFEDVAYLDPRYGRTQGARRYAYLYEGNSAFNLIQRCHAAQSRHSYITGARVPGPNVFLDCVAVDTSNDSGPHHRWATGTLYDNTQDTLMRAQNRRYSGTGHGWPGAQQMFWNTGNAQYVVQAPPHAMNWSVGQAGVKVATKFPPEEPAGIVASSDEVVTPRSLYLQQLHDRLGEAAVMNVTTDAQRHGRIWDALAAGATR